MEGTPIPGWYMDPSNGSQHRYWDGTAWTTRTRSAGITTSPFGGDPAPQRTGLWIALGLLAVAGIGTTAFLLLRPDGETVAESPSPSASTPEPISTTDPSDVVVPEGWELYTSATGVMSYAVDPAWEDLLGPADQDYIHSFYSEPEQATSEYSGAWLLSGSAWTGGTSVYIMSVSDGTEPALLRAQAKGFAGSEIDDIEILLDEEFTSAHGYEGWRIDYNAMIDDVTFPESVIMLKSGVTLIIVYATTNEATPVFADGLLTLVDSIVVHHAPAEG